MARLSTWLLTAAAASFISTTYADESRFVMVTHGIPSDPFWSVVKNGAEDAADLVGARLEYRAPSSLTWPKCSSLSMQRLRQTPMD